MRWRSTSAPKAAVSPSSARATRSTSLTQAVDASTPSKVGWAYLGRAGRMYVGRAFKPGIIPAREGGGRALSRDDALDPPLRHGSRRRGSDAHAWTWRRDPHPGFRPREQAR